ncbi:MAG: PseG/SpsG family protein [Chthonomonadales bacterium]
MRILYRADAGARIGTGHIFRALRLLQQISSRAHVDAVLATASDEAALRLAARVPARIYELPPVRDPQSVKPHFEVATLLPLLRRQEWDLVVVDMLDTPAADMEVLADCGFPIVTFDDRGPGRAYACALINTLIQEPNPSALPASVHLYEGPAYAVLDPAYANAHGAYRRPAGVPTRILVAMGGADAAGLTVKVARALRSVPNVEIVEFATGPAFPHRTQLDEAVAGAPWQAVIHVGLPRLLERYLEADLCIVAGGLTMYEVCCVGAPALAVCQPIDHQVELAERLARKGALRTLGYGHKVEPEAIAQAVLSLVHEPDVRRTMTQAGPTLVDGRGTERVAKILWDTVERSRKRGSPGRHSDSDRNALPKQR